MTLPEARSSGAWRRYLRVQYRLIRLLDPIVAAFWRGYGLGNVVELRVVGRRTGRPRRILLGLLRAGGHWFLGHPNGDVAWTRNLEAAGTAELSLSWPTTIPIRATRLPDGALRDQAILATSQHMFPGNIVYRLARRHIRAVGTYFLIEIVSPDAAPSGADKWPHSRQRTSGPAQQSMRSRQGRRAGRAFRAQNPAMGGPERPFRGPDRASRWPEGLVACIWPVGVP